MFFPSKNTRNSIQNKENEIKESFDLKDILKLNVRDGCFFNTRNIQAHINVYLQ